MGVEKLKEIVEQSMSEKEGDTVMGFANTMLGKSYYRGVEQGIQQGLARGLKESLFDLIDLRFGATDDTEHLKGQIKTQDNLDRLTVLKQHVKNGATLDELLAMLGN